MLYGTVSLSISKEISNDTRFPYSLYEFILLTNRTFVTVVVNVGPVANT